MHSIVELIKKETNDSFILENIPMSQYTSFKVGGCADVFIDTSIFEIDTIIEICNKEDVPITIVGNGTNILVGDKGIRGVTLSIGRSASGIAIIDSNSFKTGAGTLLSSLSKAALLESLSGLEFAGGIPGSVGGAIYMNAGAYGGEIKDVLVSVNYYDYEEKKVKTLRADECDLSYRHSIFSEKEIGVILEAKFSFKPMDSEIIMEKMNFFASQRREKQPLEYPSAGSTFKRPEGYYAGKLIEDSGLKGFTVGGAMVSNKHAGFVINTGKATAKDIRTLIEMVSRKVFEDTGVTLFPEVKFVGEF